MGKMPGPVVDSLTSAFIKAAETIGPKLGAKVLVYVESQDDIRFWRSILNQHPHKAVTFDIQATTKDSIATGKSFLLSQFKDGLGPFLVLCLDSDTDHLLPDLSDHSRLLNQSDFVFHTIAYGKESLACIAEGLEGNYTQITSHDSPPVNLSEMLRTYAASFSKLLLASLVFLNEGRPETLPITKASKAMHVDFSNTGLSDAFADAIRKHSAILAECLEKEPDLLSKIKSLHIELTERGYSDDQAYLFIRSHSLQDGIVLPLLNALKSKNLKETKTELELLASSPKEAGEKYKAIIGFQLDILSTLKLSQAHIGRWPHTIIAAKIDRFLQKHHA